MIATREGIPVPFVNRWNPAALVLFLLAVALTGCGEEPRPPLRIGTNVWPGYEPLYLARSLGYLSEGDFRLIEYSSSTQVLRAYRNGAIDAAALTLDEVLLLVQEGFAPRVILVMDISSGGDAIIARPGLGSMQALKGRRVGYEDTALGSYMLARALELSGMAAEDVVKLSLEIDDQEQAFDQGRVDAVVTFEPVRSRLLNKGGELLFDSSRIPGEIVDVLVVREAVLQQESRRLRTLLDQWFRALDHLERNPGDASGRMARRLGMPREQVVRMYSGLLLPARERNLDMLRPVAANGSLYLTIRQLSRVMQDEGLLRTPVTAEGILPRPLLE